MTSIRQLPTWAQWAASAPYSLGIEEEKTLLRQPGFSLAQQADAVHAALPPALAARTSTETHNAALELATTDDDTKMSRPPSQSSRPSAPTC